MTGKRFFKPWMFLSAVCLIPVSLEVVNHIAQRWFLQPALQGRGDLFFKITIWLIFGALTPLVFLASRRWPLNRSAWASVAAKHLLMAFLFCAAWTGVGTLVRALAGGEMPGGPAAFFASWTFIMLPSGVPAYFLLVGGEQAIRWFSEAKEREVQVARLSEQLVSAQLTALQAQLNPHFLFNTLNTVAVLSRDGDSRRAVSVVEQLSDVLRRTLRRQRENETTLASELDLVRQYVAIEEARFSDRLTAQIRVDSALLGLAVPSFAVQHLVDNAIRHGIAPRTEGGNIEVIARRAGDILEVEVRDDGVGVKQPCLALEGHGIANTRARLHALYGDAAALVVEPAERGGTRATLRVPARELESIA